MTPEIAVFVTDTGDTTAWNEACKLQILQKNEGQWSVVRQQDLCISASGGLALLRKQIAEIIDFLGECRVALASAFPGIMLHELERSGFSLWEIPGKPAAVLDRIVEELEAATDEEPVPSDHSPVIRELGPGSYRISIVDAQKKSGGLTSKQILLPVLQNAAFKELEIVCAHVPPWLEATLSGAGWNYRIDKGGSSNIKLCVKTV